jgi:hypothetical protein
MRRARHGDRGAVAVEFALVLPVLVLILFGIVDFGRMLNAKITLTEAAREGARATALIDRDAGEARVEDATADMEDPSALKADIDPCPASPSAEDDATVSLTYPFHFLTPLSFLGGSDGTLNLTATSVMPCLG